MSFENVFNPMMDIEGEKKKTDHAKAHVDMLNICNTLELERN